MRIQASGCQTRTCCKCEPQLRCCSAAFAVCVASRVRSRALYSRRPKPPESERAQATIGSLLCTAAPRRHAPPRALGEVVRDPGCGARRQWRLGGRRRWVILGWGFSRASALRGEERLGAEHLVDVGVVHLDEQLDQRVDARVRERGALLGVGGGAAAPTAPAAFRSARTAALFAKPGACICSAAARALGAADAVARRRARARGAGGA